MHESEERLHSMKFYQRCIVIGPSQWNPLIREPQVHYSWWWVGGDAF